MLISDSLVPLIPLFKISWLEEFLERFSPPKCRISTAMKNGQDYNAMLFCTRINAVWKTIGNNTPNVLANNEKQEGMFRCNRYATVNLSNELKSEAESLTVIPHACFTNLYTGGAMKSDRQAHYLISARAAAFTSLQGTTSFGFAR